MTGIRNGNEIVLISPFSKTGFSEKMQPSFFFLVAQSDRLNVVNEPGFYN
jgi:hypothetical protein